MIKLLDTCEQIQFTATQSNLLLQVVFCLGI